MAAKLKDNNFYTRLQEKQGNAAAKPARHFSPVVAILGGVCVLCFAALLGANLVQQMRVNKLSDWIAAPENVEQYTQAVTKQSMLNELILKQTKIDNTTQALVSYPVVNAATLQRIEDAGGESVTLFYNSYDANTGILQFDASSPEVLDIPGYVRKLESTGLFHSVTYTGYGFNAADAAYQINVSCVMRAADGEE